MNKFSFRIVTLGCRTNQYESQAYRDQLEMLGGCLAEDGESVDLCIVNSCTVTDSADNRSRHAIQQLVRDHPGARVVLTGCFAEESIPGVSLVVPNKDKENLVSILFPDIEELPEFAIKRFEAHTRAFVKVQDGCNSFCSYCIIPYVRGRSRSRPIPDILEEVRQLVSNGYQEVVLTGINIGDFEDGLANLVRAVDGVEGIKRVRVSSIDPDEIDDNLADAMLSGQHTCPSMHIVLQSGSNVVLKRMNRKYVRQQFLDTVDRLLGANPEFTFTTDVIVGFPGETEKDFQETLDMIERVRFAKVHFFPYSDRPRTRAATSFKDKVPTAEIHRRKQEAFRIAEKAAYQLRECFVGRQMTILTESGGAFGHSEHFLPVKIPGVDIISNQLVDVEIVRNTKEGLVGKIL